MLKYAKLGFVLVLLLIACTKQKPSVEIVEHELIIKRSGNYNQYYQPICQGKITNTGNGIAYKIKVYIKIKSNYQEANRTYEKYVDKVNLQPAESSDFTIEGETVTRNINPSNPTPEPTFRVIEIWTEYE